jgi:hypothetical protein
MISQTEFSVLTYLVSKLPIDEDDVALIFEDVHRGRSVIPPHLIPSRPLLVRWDLTRSLTIENCVVMEYGDGEKHVKECYGRGMQGSPAKPEDFWGEEVRRVVERRAKEIARNREYVM